METIRVFVSSTFRDMQAERDHLMGKVFTRLRAECLRRGADFVPVDLRWGITQEESDSGLSVSICLEEIDRCRFFLSLLGNRYGWIPTPEKVPLKIFARVNTPDNRSLLDRWYELDQSSAVPIYQLRPGKQPPDKVRKKLVTLWQHAGLESAGDSVTAIEISHAAFQKSRSRMHAFFYLRDLDVTGLAASFKRDFFEQEKKYSDRLQRLKENVELAGRRRRATVRSYPCAPAGLRVDVNLLKGAARKTIRHLQEDGLIDAGELRQLDTRTRAKVEKEGAVALSGMESFGEKVFNDLWKAIAPYLASERAPLDPYLQQRAYHESFLNERTRLFLGRQDSLDRILDYARDQTKREPLVITGNPGSGKSAVMAQAARLLREALPDCLVAPYFIGAAPGSNDLRQTVEYLCQTLRRECSLKEEPVLDPERLQTQLPTFLAKAARKKRVVLLIDALNQMDPAGRSHELNWLPYYLPRNVHLVVSTLPEDTFEVLLQRVPAKDVLNIRELAEKERRILIRERLAWRGKKLTEAQQHELLDRKKRPAAGLPLYLSVALEELSLLGNFDRLSARIEGLPPTLPDLFGEVLDRLELDHQIASPVLKWLTVARSGLLESEIIDLLKKFLDETRTLHWIQFYSALEAYLRPRGEADSIGRIDFYHDQLRLVSYRDYLKMKTPMSRPTPEYRRTHGQLADYFHSLANEPGLPARWRTDQRWALRELPYHLTKAGRRSEVRKLLLDFDWINAKLEATDVNSVAADYDLVPGDDQLQQVQGAIRLAASVLDGDRSQLAGQLLGRLLSAKGRGIRAMLDQAQRWRGGPWLRPLSRTLGGPGEPSARPFVGVSAVGVTPDLRRAIFASGDGTIKVWDLRRQIELRSLGEPTSSRRAVAITPDGRLALSTGKDHALNIWSPLKSAKPIRVCKGHTGTVTAIAITPDGRRMVSAAEDQTIRAWDLTRVHQESRVLGYVLPVSALAITPDGGRAVSASGEGVLQVWQTEGTNGGRIIGRHRGLVRALALTPDGQRAIASSDKTLTVWEVERRRKSRKLIGHKNLVRTVTVTADGKRAISGSDDIRVRVWDLEGESESIEFEAHAWAITALAVTRDGRNMISCSDDEMVKVWDLDALCERKAAEPLRMLTGSSGWVNAIAMMPAGDSFISASRDQTIKIWDIRKREVVRTLPGHRGWVNALAITPDGQRVVSGSDDNSVGVWDLGDKAKVRFLEGHTNGISAVAVTPNGKRAVSGCWDQTFKIWDLENWTIKRSLRGHARPKGEAWIRAIALTPDAKHFISASHDNTLRIWDRDSGKEIRRLIGHKNWVMSVAVFPDGRRAISASADKTLRIWDLDSGKETMKLEGHDNYVTCVALMPGGKHAASTSEDQTLRVWDLQTGKPVARFTADGQLRACAITGDGKLIVAGEDSGRMHFMRPELL